jgi:hypothetical protein
MVKGEGKATGKVAGRVKVKPNGLPDYPVITGNWVNDLLWPQCLNGVRRQSARSPPSGLSLPQSVFKLPNLLDSVCRFLKRWATWAHQLWVLFSQVNLWVKCPTEYNSNILLGNYLVERVGKGKGRRGRIR